MYYMYCKNKNLQTKVLNNLFLLFYLDKKIVLKPLSFLGKNSMFILSLLSYLDNFRDVTSTDPVNLKSDYSICIYR